MTRFSPQFEKSRKLSGLRALRPSQLIAIQFTYKKKAAIQLGTFLIDSNQQESLRYKRCLERDSLESLQRQVYTSGIFADCYGAENMSRAENNA